MIIYLISFIQVYYPGYVGNSLMGHLVSKTGLGTSQAQEESVVLHIALQKAKKADLGNVKTCLRREKVSLVSYCIFCVTMHSIFCFNMYWFTK